MEGPGGLFILRQFFFGGVPGSMLSCFAAFSCSASLLLFFSASLFRCFSAFCFSCFSAFLLLCFSASLLFFSVLFMLLCFLYLLLVFFASLLFEGKTLGCDAEIPLGCDAGRFPRM